MSGLKRRLSRRRAASQSRPPSRRTRRPARPEPAGGAVPAQRPRCHSAHAEGATEPLPITELPAPAEAAPATPPLPADDLPAGLDADELAAHPDSSARRARLRRRIEFLRSARELLLRDLGGFAYELHRTARDSEHEGHRRLRAVKLARLDASRRSCARSRTACTTRGRARWCASPASAASATAAASCSAATRTTARTAARR